MKKFKMSVKRIHEARSYPDGKHLVRGVKSIFDNYGRLYVVTDTGYTQRVKVGTLRIIK